MKLKKLRPGRQPLPLRNKGELQIIPIGCGGAFSKVLYQNNFLIVKGDAHVMIDCGTRTPEALSTLGRSVTDIRTWLITHSHADHIGGLEEVMLMSRYVARTKPSIIITEEYEADLWGMSLRGANEFNERHDGRGLGFADYWDTIRPAPIEGFPRDTREVSLGDLNLKLVRTRHYPEQAESWKDAAYSVGLVIDDRILFSGDTQFDADLIRQYDEMLGLEYIFHDVQFFTGGVHTGIDELSTLTEALKSKMLLMHYGDNWKDQRKRVESEGFLGFTRQQWSYTFS